MSIAKQKHVLVAVLDWGLGHATRSIPIIRLLMNQGHRVSVSGSGSSLQLLKAEFEELQFHTISPYHIRYSKSVPFMVNMIWQVPKINRAIRKEHREIDDIVRQEKVDYIISDNRYGCWSSLVPCVILSHQLNIILPWHLSWAKGFVNRIIRKYIQRFDRCWVPDDPEIRLTNELTSDTSIPISFVGLLSRFKKIEAIEKKENSMLVVLSGPEPQRTVFEKLVVNELKRLNKAATLVQGIPGGEPVYTMGSITMISHLSSPELNKVIQRSDILIARSGYSTIMDLITVGASKIILIPTPGQTEQEYLASQLAKRKVAVVQAQDEIDLEKALQALSHTSGFESRSVDSNLLEKGVDEFLAIKK